MWWNAVSHTTTFFRFGATSIIASTPIIAPGLCNGASEIISSRPLKSSFVTKVGFTNNSPPCTTLWPIAYISSIEDITPNSLSIKALSWTSIPSLWFSIFAGTSSIDFPFNIFLYIKFLFGVLSRWPLENPPRLNTCKSSVLSWGFILYSDLLAWAKSRYFL